jgi:hypothetical protein
VGEGIDVGEAVGTVGVDPVRVAVADGTGGVDTGTCNRVTGRHETVSRAKRTANAAM